MNSNKRVVIQVFFLVMSVVLIGLGISNNEPFDVMNKAIRICFECIGIG
jgi:hypothetical protein